MVEWDLWDYDWGWQPTPPEYMRLDVETHMIGTRQDRAWAEEDEPRYVAALLAAGAEPATADFDAHEAWQRRAAEVLMQKYRRHWWYQWLTGERLRGDPKYRQKAETCRRDVQLDEFRRFYTWVCKQRKEPWTDKIVPY